MAARPERRTETAPQACAAGTATTERLRKLAPRRREAAARREGGARACHDWGAPLRRRSKRRARRATGCGSEAGLTPTGRSLRLGPPLLLEPVLKLGPPLPPQAGLRLGLSLQGESGSVFHVEQSLLARMLLRNTIHANFLEENCQIKP